MKNTIRFIKHKPSNNVVSEGAWQNVIDAINDYKKLNGEHLKLPLYSNDILNLPHAEVQTGKVMTVYLLGYTTLTTDAHDILFDVEFNEKGMDISEKIDNSSLVLDWSVNRWDGGGIEFNCCYYNPKFEITTREVIVYHHGCQDGQTALAFALYAMRNAEVVKGKYQEDIDIDVFTGADVYILDFSYPLSVMEQILAVANKVYLFDHHVSAIRNMEPILDKIFFPILDTERCGAQIAYDYFIRKEDDTHEYPSFLNLIAARDLWINKTADADRLNLALKIKAKNTMDFVNIIVQMLLEHNNGDSSTLNSLLNDGAHYLEYHESICREIASKALNGRLYDETPVLIVNCPQMFASDVGAILANKSPSGVSVTYEVKENATKYSLRASEWSEYDVSRCAQHFGGGGHKKAAGYALFQDKVATKPNNLPKHFPEQGDFH